jgi:hypothetical protein
MARSESELAAAQRQASGLDANLSSVAAEREELLAERDGLRHANDELAETQRRLEEELAGVAAEQRTSADALARERERAAAAERAASDAVGRADEYRALVDSVGAPGGSAERPPGGAAGATWRILLATLDRRWAAGVGAPPDARGIREGTVSEQLAEALRRESERLREEVGVDVEVRTGAPLELADPVTFLLAATDVLGVLSMECERVVLELDESLVLRGEGWSGPVDELELARAQAVASGVIAADEIAVDDEGVTLALRPTGRAPAPT